MMLCVKDLNRFYISITALIGAYEPFIVHGLTTKGFRVSLLRSASNDKHLPSAFVELEVSLPEERFQKMEQELVEDLSNGKNACNHSAVVYQEVLSVLNSLGVKFYSLGVSQRLTSCVNGANFLISDNQPETPTLH